MMGFRITLTLDEDLVLRLKEESRLRGIPFRKLLNDALRRGLEATTAVHLVFKVRPVDLGTFQGMKYDNIGQLIELAEGDRLR